VPCPAGYSGSSNACAGSAENVSFVFDKITYAWTHSSYTFHAGTDSSVEANIEPFSYKLRGLYFDGVDDLLTMDSTTRLYLHSEVSMNFWINPYTLGGTVFSKAFADYTDSSTSKFISVDIQSDGSVDVAI
jgi:hypothetical protein